MRVGNAIYMDYQSTTPVDPAVREAMLPFLGEQFGNPHSSSHRFGWEADAAVDVARGRIAALLNVDPGHILFTGGATESNNIAIKGAALAQIKTPGKILTTQTEHSCVIQSAAACSHFGHQPVFLPVHSNGLIDLEAFEDALDPSVHLVSVMLVNNEIGVIQPLEEIAALAHEVGALVHCDAAQAFGKVPIDFVAQNCDLMSLSGHKIYGPKGIGALYAPPQVQRRLGTLISGGEQEGPLRSGTLAPGLCAGFGQAALTAQGLLETEGQRAARHFDDLFKGLEEIGVPFQLNGCATHRLKSNLNVSFEGIDSAKLMSGLRRLAVSSGAACASAKEGPSYVLAALGVPPMLAEASLRIGTGRFTDDAQVADALTYLEDALKKAVKRSWSA